MISLNDVMLLIVVLISMLTGIIFPRFGAVFHDYPLYCLMILLFLSFLSIDLPIIWSTLKSSFGKIVCLSLLKIALLPVVVYYVFKIVAPSYAVAALLLSGVSTGVVAPFISNLVKGNSSLVMVLVVITSVLVPFTLPALIKVLLGHSVDMSLSAMIQMLALVIFLPFIAAESLRRLAPQWPAAIFTIRFPLSLILFAVVNLGIFSRYADFFHREPIAIITATAVAVLLSLVFCLVGLVCMMKKPVEDQLAGAITLANMNNVLIIVFAARYFGPLEPTVAAIYILPFFGLLIPLRMYYNLRKRHRGLTVP
ncbi:MAG: bile acid:sodium symporter [Deltaproteobacteria bacterium]|nr:bile acid:sodium symporter [Deltaproteobacteria bacterium]MBN2688717.1 bile acid:sodium symporter [Deltaproteobacteria bacterium]